MRTRAQQLARRTAVVQRWNAGRDARNMRLWRWRGLLYGVAATRVGDGFKVGQRVLLAVVPGSELVIGDHVTLYDEVRLQVEAPGARLTIGDCSGMNRGVQVFCRGEITIGTYTLIGYDSKIMDSSMHTLDGDDEALPVVIGDRVLIASNVTVMRGVTIGDGAVVGAGSLVVTDLPAGMLCVGVPARPIRPVTWS